MLSASDDMDDSSSKAITNKTTTSMFLSQSDSDDENSFEPPALSAYALALLEKEKEHINPTKPKQNTKKVIFSKSPKFNTIHQSHNLTSHTNNSEYETIFTKTVTGDYNSYTTSTSPNQREQKTPFRVTSAASGSENPTTRSRSSIRRSRVFRSLGPPKRASDIEQQQQQQIQGSLGSEINDTFMRDVDNSPPKQQQESHLVPAYNNTKQFDFEGLNPYQYSRKYNLPQSELPKLSKIYLEQQKDEAKEDISFNSPIRLKEAIHSKIEEELQAKRASEHPPLLVKEPFKDERHLRENQKIRIYSETESPKGFMNSRIYDENNVNQHRSPSERPKKVTRQPLSQINGQSKFNIQRNNSSNKQKASDIEAITEKPSSIHSKDYEEYHYNQREPLKAPDPSYRSTSRILNVNGKPYEKLELLGKGGSSKVFKVKSLSNKVYAIKKISFDEFDDSSIKGFKGEIDLLNKLSGEERVVKLIDYSLMQGSLLLVMECGDIDLSHVLLKRVHMLLDVEFVRFYANEILKCVKAVHDADIVHSDLKPANFLFVKGILKIIDFGIANAVPDHTVNIYRESQIGTPNYMAPEALVDNNQHLPYSSINQKSTWKVGKPSDIWSCGCIIYQMLYGRPPYGGYQGSQRLLAIMNPEVKIAYPENGLGGVKIPKTAVETIEACLRRDPNQRWTAQQVLDGPFLKPRVVSEQFVNDLVKNAITYGVTKSSVGDEELKTLANDVWRRISQLSL